MDSANDDDWMRTLALKPGSAESKRAFRQLFDRHGGLVLGYCTRILADRPLAEDVAQEIWMKVIQGAKNYEGRRQLRAWLLTITRRTALNAIRSRKEWRDLETSHDQTGIEDGREVLQTLVNASDSRLVRNAIDQLPAPQRTALCLCVIEDLSYEEIAKAMGASIGAVKTHIHRGRQAVQVQLRHSASASDTGGSNE